MSMRQEWGLPLASRSKKVWYRCHRLSEVRLASGSEKSLASSWVHKCMGQPWSSANASRRVMTAVGVNLVQSFRTCIATLGRRPLHA